MGVYRDFLKSDNEYCLIFEDDIELLTHDLKNDIIKNMNNLPLNWNILLLGYEIDEKHESDVIQICEGYFVSNIFWNALWEFNKMCVYLDPH